MKKITLLLLVLIAPVVTAGGVGRCPVGDLNGDCKVDRQDLAILADQWLVSSPTAANLDGINGVNLTDFALLAENWLTRAGQITLVINEFMAKNDGSILDPYGDYDDWIEIYNYGDEAVDIGGMYLADNPTSAGRWRIPNNNPSLTTIPSHGYLLIWADEETGEGILHASFKLSAGGEQIGLYDAGGNLIDSIVFGPQNGNESYGRLPDGSDNWQVFTSATPGASNTAAPVEVVINEIMYHSYHALNTPEKIAQEYIELFNRGAEPANLSGWRLTDGVDFSFPQVVLGAGQYLVVAADVNVFIAKYPGVSNVVGGWVGRLGNSGERIELADDTGVVIDAVRYADEGDWAVRLLGPIELGHRGWEWSDAHDGGGKSLELINPAMPNEYGQNWTASKVDNGTPGAANSVLDNDIAPLILDVGHFPMIPDSNEPVTVSARIIDELKTGVTVILHYRVDRSQYQGTNVYPQYNASDYNNVTMFDDGAHGDDQVGDGIYGARIPPHADKTIIEFFIQATDKNGKSRTWSAPSLIDGVSQQVTNLLYQVDQTFDPAAPWVAGSQPVYYIIMTEMERGRLTDIGAHSTNQGPNSQMNATFISVDGVGMDVRYNLGIRNRGHGTRTMVPMNLHVNFPHDRLWKNVTVINLITNYSWVWVAGGSVYGMSGIAQPDSFGVQVRINGQNLAPLNMTRTQGSYAHVEVVDTDWARRHFPDDPGGNAYKCMGNVSPPADLRYLDNPDQYRIAYSKETNAGEDDWSDLIRLTYALSNNTPDSSYVEEVNRNLNVEQWLRFFAVNNLANNREASLGTGTGDEYFMYCGVNDPRFVLIQHDLECMFGQGDETAPSVLTNGIFRATSIAAINRFLKHPQFVQRYYWHLKNLAETIFSAEQFNPFIDNLLGNWLPAGRITSIKDYTAQYRAYVLSVIPLTIKVTSAPAVQNNYYHTTSNLVSLAGQANAITTRRVTVNGSPAVWTAWQAAWSISNVSLMPGINRVVIQAFDAGDKEVDRSSIDIWYETGSMTTKAGGSLSADEVWTTAAGPYHVTGSITIPAGRTLTIQAGTTVFFDSGCGFTVYGRIVAQGTEYRRIRFTRLPGTSTQWAGFQLPDTEQDNIIAYADVEFGGSRSHWITTGNNNSGAVGPTARLTVDHATFSGSDTQYFSIWDPQIIICNSVFADLGTHYMCMVERMPADGWFIIEGNLFGHTHGDTDIFHLNSVSVKGGPVAQIINNVFTGGGDDLIDDNETDTHIEGNLFMHANVGNTGRSASAAVTTGPGGGSASANNLESQHLTVVRNIFYHNDYGILCKTGAYAQVYNNVFIQNAGAILLNEFVGSNPNQPGRACYVESCIFWNNGPDVDGNSNDNGTGTFVNRQSTQLAVNNSIVKSQYLNLGTGNIDADPLLVDADRELYVDVALPRFSTGFPGFADGGYLLEGMVPDVRLRPESPARGAGFNGVDMGPYVPTTASIGGVPPSPTWRTDATITIAGTDIYGYKYRIAGPGFDNVWSAELARMMPVTALTRNGVTATATVANHGFTDGDVVEVLGADRAAYNGQFTIFAVKPNTFSYALAAAVDLLHPEHLDVWVRRPQPIQLAGLTNGIYTVSAIRKNSMDVWQDENQPTTATWMVDTTSSRLVINEVLAHNKSAVAHEGTFPDMVELYYDGPASLNLSGMRMTDDPNDRTKFVFPAGATIASGQYLVLFADANAVTSGVHLGFALADEGESIYLYDKNGTLIDSVEFGLQLPDLSIGRVGFEDNWHLTKPTFGAANVAQPLGNPDTLKINEWLANGQVLFEEDFIELYNPHANPVDLSGMYLTDNPVTQPGKHKIGPLSFIAGGGYAVFWADNSKTSGHVGFRLSADAGMIGLFDSQLKQIDKILYGPQTTDVSQGRAPDGANSFDFMQLPTPGVSNPGKTTTTTAITLMAENATKRVRVPTGAISDNWKGGAAFDDSGWNDGTFVSGKTGGVGYENNPGDATNYTPFISRDVKSLMYNIRGTCYIRIPFTVDANIINNITGLTLKMRYDDGFLAYINGTALETATRNFTGTPAWNSLATSTHADGDAVNFEHISISGYIGALRSGSNILAIHGLNGTSTTSSDFLISPELEATIMEVYEAFPYPEALKLLDGLRITELMYHSPHGSDFDYIELQNVSDVTLDLTGVRFTKGIEFTFPQMQLAPGEFVVVAGNLASFRLRYGSSVRVAGQYSGNLSNNGEDIVLNLPLPLEAAIMRFSYSDQWYPTTDGGGQSLVIVDPMAHPAAWSLADSWQPADPTPGTP